MSSDTGFWNTARQHPDRTAVVAPDGTETTYGGLHAMANRIVHALRSLGVQRGDGIGILLPNCTEFVATMLAANQAGFYFTPINHHFKAAEIAYILDNAAIKVLVAHETFGDQARAAVAELGEGQIKSLSIGAVEGFDSFADLVGRQASDEPTQREAGSLMSYTSGTTGRPKGVRRPLSGVSPELSEERSAPFNMLRIFGMQAGADDVHIVVSPLYHNAPNGFAQFALQLGHTLVLTKKFQPLEFLELVERHRVTSTHMAPVQFNRLLALPDEERTRFDTSSLRVVGHAGAPCPPEVKRRMIEWLGPVVYEYYSASEGVGGTMVTPQEALERPGTVGRPFREGTVVKILDVDGDEVPVGEVGVVYTTLPGSGFNYHRDESKSAAARVGDFFTVGDFGRLDEDGYLYLVSRRTDLILSGGVNIYPAEIEAVLLEHPAVLDAAVFGIPNTEWGEEVKAVVQLVDGAVGTDDLVDDVLLFCRGRLASFKVPKSIDYIDTLPRDPNGKLFKRQLRDPYWETTPSQ